MHNDGSQSVLFFLPVNKVVEPSVVLVIQFDVILMDHI